MDSNSHRDGICCTPRDVGQRRERVATAQLFFSTTLFGASFVGQKIAMTQGIGPFTYTACRFIVSTALLCLFRPLIQRLVHSAVDVGHEKNSVEGAQLSSRELYKWATLCGVAAFGGSNLQQIGLSTVSAGKTAFITGMYVIFVPIVEWTLPGFGLKLNWRVWASAVVSLLGMFYLSGNSKSGLLGGESNFNSGEIIVFISMLFWVISIISADVGTKRGVDGVSFTVWEFAVSTVLSLTLAVIFESEYLQYPFNSILKTWKMILLVGITEGVSFLFGTLGQMYIAPSKAALIYSLESVTAAVGAYFFLGETLSHTELFGCFLMLSAAVLCSYQSELDELDTSGFDDLIERGTLSKTIEIKRSNLDTDNKMAPSRNSVNSVTTPLVGGIKRIPYHALKTNETETVCVA